MARERDRTVYSTGASGPGHDAGRCPRCGKRMNRCRCREQVAAKAEAEAGDGVARVRREKKGRGGKTVTTVTGIPLPADELRELAKELKRVCGSGGTLKQGVVEIQGDHAEVVLAALEERGLRAKRAGG